VKIITDQMQVQFSTIIGVERKLMELFFFTKIYHFFS